MRRWDIGSRVLVAALLPAAMIAIALASYFTATRIVDLETSVRNRGVALARQLAAASEPALRSGNDALLKLLAESMAAEPGVRAVAIVDARGERRAGNGTRIAAFAPNRGATLTFRELDSESTVVLHMIGSDTAPPLGHIALEVQRSDTAPRKRELALNAVLITLIGLLLGGLFARELTRGATRPLRQLAAVVGDIERGNLAARANTDSSGLVKELETGINDMAMSLADARANLERRIAAATAQLQQEKERAEAANRTKSQFLAAASHDLRQPLQALGLFVSSLNLRAREPDIQNLAGRIERAHGALEGVLDALLDITQLDSGNVTPNVKAFPLAHLFANVRETFAVTAAEKSLRLAVPATGLWVESDPALLERVVSNLVSNGLRYTDHGGVVLGARRDGAAVRIEVWDSGIGIPAGKRTEVFREFVRLDEGKRGRGEGIGLGLAIVDRLCKLLGHAVNLRSRPGSGTVFTVTVPRALPAAPSIVPVHTDRVALDLGGVRVLLIDDDAEVLDALDNFFTHQGAPAVTATSLRAALDAVELDGFVPDVIISDYRIGGLETGIDAVQTINRAAGARAPAIIITGETSSDVLSAIAAAGHAHLAKPARAEPLRALLHALLHERAAAIQ